MQKFGYTCFRFLRSQFNLGSFQYHWSLCNCFGYHLNCMLLKPYQILTMFAFNMLSNYVWIKKHKIADISIFFFFYELLTVFHYKPQGKPINFGKNYRSLFLVQYVNMEKWKKIMKDLSIESYKKHKNLLFCYLLNLRKYQRKLLYPSSCSYFFSTLEHCTKWILV